MATAKGSSSSGKQVPLNKILRTEGYYGCGTDVPPTCCHFHFLVGHIANPSDYFYRSLYLFTASRGTEFQLPSYELYMMCHKLLFTSLEPIGMRSLVEAALGFNEAAVAEFYEFTDFRLNTRVLYALNYVVVEYIDELCGLREEQSVEYYAELLTLIGAGGPDKGEANVDLVLWLAFKTVSVFLLDHYRHHYQLDFAGLLHDWQYLTHIFARASTFRVPRLPNGKHAMPEVDTAAILLLHKLDIGDICKDTVASSAAGKEGDGARQAFARTEEYAFYRFFQDAEVDLDCPERQAMVERLQHLVKKKEFMNIDLRNQIKLTTRMATGKAGDTLSKAEHDLVWWLVGFVGFDPCEAGRFHPPVDQRRRLSQLIDRRNILKGNPRDHAKLISKNEFKRLLADVYRFRRSSGTALVELQRLLECVSYLCIDLNRIPGVMDWKNEYFKSMLPVMKDAHAHRDWHTFAMACMPLIMYNFHPNLTLAAAEKLGIFQWFLDSFESRSMFVLWSSCCALSLLWNYEPYSKRMTRIGYLEKLLDLLRNPEIDGATLMYACMMVPPLVSPSSVGMLPADTAMECCVVFNRVLVSVLTGKQNFDTARFRIRPHEITVQNYQNKLCPELKEKLLPRSAGYARSWTLVSILSILSYVVNHSDETNKEFFQLGGFRMVHLAIRDKDKSVMHTALKAGADLVRVATQPYRQALVKMPQLIGDVARIFAKYRREASEEKTLDILCSLCTPMSNDSSIWTEWLEDEHTRKKFLPRLLRHAGNIRPLSTITFAMGIVALLARHANDHVVYNVTCSDMISICNVHIGSAPRLFGERKTLELVHYSLQTMMYMLKRNSNLLDHIHTLDVFPNILQYCGAAHLQQTEGFSQVCPVWVARSDDADLHAADMRKLEVKQRYDTMSSALQLVDLIVSLRIDPETFFALKFLEAGYMDNVERVWMKVNFNLGQHMVKKNNRLVNVDTLDQWGWYEALYHARIIRHICSREVSPLFIGKFFSRSFCLNSLQNLLLVAHDTKQNLDDIRQLCDTLLMIATVVMPSHFTRDKAAGESKTLLMQVLESRQSLYRNKWKGEMLIDTVLTLLCEYVGTSTYNAFARLAECFNTCCAEDPQLALPIEASETYKRLKKTGEVIPILGMAMIEQQIGYCHGKPGVKAWDKPSEVYVAQDFKELPDYLKNVSSVPKEQPVSVPKDTGEPAIPVIVVPDPSRDEMKKVEAKQADLKARKSDFPKLPMEDVIGFLSQHHAARKVYDRPEDRGKFVREARRLKGLRETPPPSPTSSEFDGEEEDEEDNASSQSDADEHQAASENDNGEKSRQANLDESTSFAVSEEYGKRTVSKEKTMAASAGRKATTDKTDSHQSPTNSLSSGSDFPASENQSSLGDQSSGSGAQSVTVSSCDGDDESYQHVSRGCHHCGVEIKKAKRCGRCLKARYCSKECQRAAWKAHREVCVQDTA